MPDIIRDPATLLRALVLFVGVPALFVCGLVLVHIYSKGRDDKRR
jgi:hypothetical protein